MTKNYCYVFPALRGIQAGQEYYVAMCPLRLLPRLFQFDGPELPPELRAQRTLNAARIPEIMRYIVDNHHDYSLSAITVSIDGEVEFEPINPHHEIGTLTVSMTARFVINDGQHRRAAIEAALEERPELGDEAIAVVFYIDANLHRSQQIFADLNKHASKPTKSLGILYDYRDPLACLVRYLADNVPCFAGLTEKEATTISNRSIKIFTLSGIYQATGAFLNKQKNAPLQEEEKERSRVFWFKLSEFIPEWQLAVKHQIGGGELRREYVHAHSVTLHAFGIAGYSLAKQRPDDWEKKLEVFSEVNWSRRNELWEGYCITRGQMNKSRDSLYLTAILFKKILGLDLTESEIKADERVQSRRTRT